MINQASKNEQAPSDLETTAKMLDDRIIQAQEFGDDDFVNSKEFKLFLFKLKKNQISLTLQLGYSEEKIIEVV